MLLYKSFLSWIGQLFSCMGGCVGCCTKSTPIIAVDEPAKGLKIQGLRVNKPTPSEVFWNTSTYEMDNNGIQSQRSISSLSTSNQTIDSNCGPSSTSATEFVNHVVYKFTFFFCASDVLNKCELPSWNATYDSLLGTNKPFPQPIPLSEMVDFLVDVWEAEGMYD
ncbi:unnamed protein product [Victoria cruziana]